MSVVVFLTVAAAPPLGGDWGLCCAIDAAATERLMEEWRGWRVARRKNAEENSLAGWENMERGEEVVVKERAMYIFID